MTNIYLTDLDKEVIVDFVKDHDELYDKTKEHFKDKARKECLWERFASCLSRCARLGLNPKGLSITNSCSPSLVRLQKKSPKGRTGFRINLTS